MRVLSLASASTRCEGVPVPGSRPARSGTAGGHHQQATRAVRGVLILDPRNSSSSSASLSLSSSRSRSHEAQFRKETAPGPLSWQARVRRRIHPRGRGAFQRRERRLRPGRARRRPGYPAQRRSPRGPSALWPRAIGRCESTWLGGAGQVRMVLRGSRAGTARGGT